MPYCTILNFSDPFRDLVSAMAEDESPDNFSTIPNKDFTTLGQTITTITTTTITTTTTTEASTTTLPKSCPAPDVTYNGSLLSTVEAFKDIHDVEFEVRTGPFPGDNQRCKLTCVKGQWVGPLCRTKESKK